MPVANRLVNQRQIASAVQKAAALLAPDVVRIRYTLRDDATGVASIFFRVLLSDQASKEADLYETTERISDKILEIVKPLERFGLEYYFNYRSVSEQAKLKDAVWE